MKYIATVAFESVDWIKDQIKDHPQQIKLLTLPEIIPFTHLGIKEGDVEIREEDLSLIPADDLKKFHITRAELRRCFAEAMELMQGATQEDWTRRRPVCEQTRDGKWEVHGPIGYNLEGDDYNGPKGTA